jgi:septal ring factor EnvC (AmiA/AmiB activator)
MTVIVVGLLRSITSTEHAPMSDETSSLKARLLAARAEITLLNRQLDEERAEKALLVQQLKETLKQVEETTEVLRQINRYR